MAKRRQISDEQKVKDGAWLKALLEANGMQQQELAAEMEVEVGNVRHWARGGSRIPDLDLLWIGRRFGVDVFSIRPILKDYAQYFGSASILDGLSETSRTKIVNDISFLRRLELSQPPAVMEYTGKIGPKATKTPAKRKGKP